MKEDSIQSARPSPAVEFAKLAVPTTDGLLFVYLKDVAYCKASSNYTEISMVDGSLLLVSRTLKHYEVMLSEHGFFRIHHSFLINLMYLEKYVRGDGGYVIMQDGKTFDVSKRKRDCFLKKIGKHFLSLPSLAGSSTPETINKSALSLANS
jgi:two-component system LytT family response regulator